MIKENVKETNKLKTNRIVKGDTIESMKDFPDRSFDLVFDVFYINLHIFNNNKYMYKIEEPIYFYLFIIIPVIIGMHLLVFFWKKKAQKKFT